MCISMIYKENFFNWKKKQRILVEFMLWEIIYIFNIWKVLEMQINKLFCY